MNAYILITLSTDKSLTRLNNIIAKSLKEGLPHQLPHWRFNNDKSEVILQGEFTPKVFEELKQLSFVQYLGDYKNGFAEKKVNGYISTNKLKWEVEESVR